MFTELTQNMDSTVQNAATTAAVGAAIWGSLWCFLRLAGYTARHASATVRWLRTAYQPSSPVTAHILELMGVEQDDSWKADVDGTKFRRRTSADAVVVVVVAGPNRDRSHNPKRVVGWLGANPFDTLAVSRKDKKVLRAAASSLLVRLVQRESLAQLGAAGQPKVGAATRTWTKGSVESPYVLYKQEGEVWVEKVDASAAATLIQHVKHGIYGSGRYVVASYDRRPDGVSGVDGFHRTSYNMPNAGWDNC